MKVAYFDASALVKLAVREVESDVLAAAARELDVRVTSIVGRIELERAVRRLMPAAEAGRRTAPVLAGTTIVPFDIATSALAGRVVPRRLRTLDAIHVATVLALADEVEACYCYDELLTTALEQAGVPVLAPG